MIDEYENSLDDYYKKNPEPSEEEEYDEHPAQERVEYQAGLSEFLYEKETFMSIKIMESQGI